jgi:hypothetical protein
VAPRATVGVFPNLECGSTPMDSGAEQAQYEAMLFQCAICPAVVLLVLIGLVGLSVIADRHGRTF